METPDPSATTSTATPQEMPRASFVVFHIPDDPPLLRAVGTVALRHAHLDYALKLTIKTLTDVSIDVALAATEYESSSSLRERIRKIARRRIGDGAALIKLQALMTQCQYATQKRNDLMHNIWARDLDGGPQTRVGGKGWLPLPTAEELNALAREIQGLVSDLNEARLEGFLHEALRRVPKTD